MTANTMIWDSTAEIQSVASLPRSETELTMQRDQHRHRLPDTPPTRVGRDPKANREAGNDGKADAEVCEVACGAPDHAELLVLLLAAVGDAQGEGPAVVVRVCDVTAVPAWDLDDLELAAAAEAVFDNDGLVDDVRVVHDEPGGGQAGHKHFTWNSWPRDRPVGPLHREGVL